MKISLPETDKAMPC